MTIGCPKGCHLKMGCACVTKLKRAKRVEASACAGEARKGPRWALSNAVSQAWEHGEATSRASRALLLNQRGQMCSSDEVFDGRCVSPNSELTALLLTLWSTVGELPGTNHCARRRTSQDDYCVSTCFITLR